MNTTERPSTTASPATRQQSTLKRTLPMRSRGVLNFCPDSREPGEAAGYERAKVRVYWHDWGREGRCQACLAGCV
jgi:hypothetical protein